MLTVRDVRADVRALYEEMAYDFYRGDAVLYPMTAEKLAATLDMALAGSPMMRLVIMEDGGECVGYGNLSFTWSTEAGGMVMWIEEIYVRPQHRGCGYGSAFLQWAEDAYAGQVKRFRLEVCPENPDAKRLYERHGYRDMGYLPMVRE